MSAQINNRKEKPILVKQLSTKELQSKLDSVKPKHKAKILKELQLRGA
jgi:hypothetical protein